MLEVKKPRLSSMFFCDTLEFESGTAAYLQFVSVSPLCALSMAKSRAFFPGAVTRSQLEICRPRWCDTSERHSSVELASQRIICGKGYQRFWYPANLCWRGKVVSSPEPELAFTPISIKCILPWKKSLQSSTCFSVYERYLQIACSGRSGHRSSKSSRYSNG